MEDILLFRWHRNSCSLVCEEVQSMRTSSRNLSHRAGAGPSHSASALSSREARKRLAKGGGIPGPHGHSSLLVIVVVIEFEVVVSDDHPEKVSQHVL